MLEADDIVGGISRTAQYKGFRFDIGGHRFFTKIAPVEELWHEILGDEFISVPRLSRIHYNGKFFDYPLKAGQRAQRASGRCNALLIVLSYLKWHYRPYPVEENFEQWVTNRFGKRLYEIFFKTYTEKVWGIPCTEIRAEWAAQRIQGLSLAKAILNGDGAQQALDDDQDADQRVPVSAARARADVGDVPRPRSSSVGNQVLLQHYVDAHRAARTDASSRCTAKTPDGRARRSRPSTSSRRCRSGSLVRALAPAAPPPVRERRRGAALPRLPGRRADPRSATTCFPTTGSTSTRPGVKVGRIQNFNNWSAAMVPDARDDLPRAWSTSASRATGSGRARTRI